MEKRNRVGFVVPTLGDRDKTLRRTLESIRPQADLIVLVAPEGQIDTLKKSHEDVVDVFTPETRRGLAPAINLGFQQIPPEFDFVSWLGDDDFLEPNAIRRALSCVANLDETSAVYGNCNYVNENGDLIFTQKSGILAKFLLKTGPDLIPQPGSILNHQAMKSIGFLDENFRLAFDYDMFLKLSKHGKLIFANATLANFTWHSESLSVKQREESMREASLARKNNASTARGKIALALSPFANLAALLAGKLVTQIAQKRKTKKS